MALDRAEEILKDKVPIKDAASLKERAQQIELIGRILTTQVRVGDLKLRERKTGALSKLLDLIKKEEDRQKA